MLPTVVLSLGLLLAASVTDAAVSYTRWGRTTCPAGTIVLYTGYMAGPYWWSGGSGGNFLCMNQKPQFVRGIPGRQGASGLLFGVELESSSSRFPGLFLGDNVPGGDVNNQDLPCVRCYVQGSSDLLLMPGRQDCGTSGYDLQYKGFLVSEVHDASSTRSRSEYVCMDEAPEGIPGGQGNNDNSVAHPVEVGCGSLPCNPYLEGYEATCAVCTY